MPRVDIFRLCHYMSLRQNSKTFRTRGYLIYSLISRHNIKDDVRQSLYDAANEWTAAVKKKGTTFLGGEKPNLADISVYGVLSSIEGCGAFQVYISILSMYPVIL